MEIGILEIFAIILLLLTVISLVFSILLFKKNKSLEELITSSFQRDDNVLVQIPESVENNINIFISRYQNFESKIQEYLQKNVSSILVNAKETRDLINQFDEISKKNSELIERYKEGYDYYRYKSIVSKLVLSLDFIINTKNKIKDEEALEYINSYIKNLENIMLEIGLEDHTPSINTNIKDNNGIEVRTDYQPNVSGRMLPSLNVIDPKSGLAVPVGNIEEHMRVELMDPKWKEEQIRAAEKRKNTNVADGSSISDNLAAFASKVKRQKISDK
mgnify:CR=1 FL=1